VVKENEKKKREGAGLLGRRGREKRNSTLADTGFRDGGPKALKKNGKAWARGKNQKKEARKTELKRVGDYRWEKPGTYVLPSKPTKREGLQGTRVN